MPDRKNVIKGLEIQLDDLQKYADSDEMLTLTQEQAKEIVALLKEQEHKDRMFHALEDDWKRLKKLLKEQEAVKPRVSTVEQRCGNCNKVIEMDGWITCPWCGKPILWEGR